MQKYSWALGVGMGILLAMGLGFLGKTDDIRGFDEALAGRYGQYEGALSYARNRSASPCATDGLGIRPVLFGTLVSWCDATWFYGSGLLVQVAGPWVTRSAAEQYITVPNELGAKEIMRSARDAFLAGETFEAMDEGDEPYATLFRDDITIARDWGEQRIYSEQIASAKTLGDVVFATVLQKSVNTPITNLPNGTITEFAGIIARKGSGPWLAVLDMQQYATTPNGSLWLLSPNVHTVRLENNELYVDILEGAGAGSGEGTLVRVQYDFTDTSQFLVWKPLGELYYVPETFSWDTSWSMLAPITENAMKSGATL